MFRFTIREMLWLTMVAALAMGWWLHQRAWVEKYSAMTLDCETWHARTEELQVRADLLAERLRGNPTPAPAAPTTNPPGNQAGKPNGSTTRSPTESDWRGTTR
jgi:hypothetical protein